MATLSIIDLAGSERAAATTNMGQRMVEGANINKSLLALGNCINALCESGGAIRHVPYRNSKLTRLLKFSLGGNCKTVMIVCVAPTSHHFDDTHNTLIYAERATKIKTKVVTRNVVNVDRHVGRYVEAINRLNAEVAELKAKLAGKKDNEEQLVRRKKAEANAEVERAKHDMQVKVDQTKASIIDGAACSGKLSVARAKLDPIRQRLTKLESMGTLSADLEAERALLKAVAGPEEQALKSDSVLSVRLQRSSNANAMFDATMRAVSERKSEKLDEVSVENVKLDARCRRAEMEQAKAEEERDVMNSAVSDIAQTMVGLIGMLGRCTVMIGEASSNLRSPHDDPAATAQSIAAMLDNLKAKNDEAFTQLVGHSTEGYRLDERASLGVFKGYDMSFTRRVSSGPPALQNTSSSSSRRLSSHTSLSASPRRHKSPRKSLRSSLAAQPYRRVSDKEKKGLKMSKNVQWRDEAGQGDLVDEGLSLNPITVNVIPASPFTDSISAPSVTETPPTRASSVAGSESEWESEGEKTDDSVSFNLSMSLPASFSDTLSRSGVPGKRPRPSRLDPSFLKSKARTPALGSLAEDDESSPERRERRVSQPLGDRNINQMDGDVLGSKVKQAGPSSPGKRAPSTPRGASKSRRRSNIGPVRAEKGRRRSSMIPQLSPPNGEGSKPRRVLLGTPAKRSKRLSLSRPAPIPMRRPPSSASSNLSIADTSISVSRPTWR